MKSLPSVLDFLVIFPYCIMHGSGERGLYYFCYWVILLCTISGRSLSNSVINLGVRDQYADALNQLGFEFEVLAEQVSEAFVGKLLFDISQDGL